MTKEILVIDDNSDIRKLISGILIDKGFSVREAANYDQAILEINKKLPDVSIIDVKLDKGDNDGIELLSYIKKIDDDVPVIMISGHANVQMAVDSLKLGAFEFIQKPFTSERLLNFLNRAIENVELKKEKNALESKLFTSYEIIGISQSIEKVKNLVNKLSNTESRVFISGPAGSGKELVARQIHKQSSRSKKPFVVVNGALLDPQKYEFELFGFENKDDTANYGFFEKAKDGTLLIDEVTEIPLATQAKILRVLIDQKFRRVNGSKEINVNVRIISTSSKNIREEVDKGNFREDLYHRLNVVPIFLPALKDRSEDIPHLLNYFSKKISELNGINETKLLFRYPVRVALNPIISTIGWLLPVVVSGEIITALVIGIPTVGPLLFRSLQMQDMFLAASLHLLLNALTVVGTLISDILLVVLDPRIRFEAKS